MSAEIIDQFQRVLGRAPRQDEIDYFKKFVDQGELQAYDIGQILGSTPEAQSSMLKSQTQEYGNMLGASDEAMMRRSSDQLASQFAQQGRAKSSGYVSAYLSAAQNLAMQRQQRMADFYGTGLGEQRSMAAGLGQQSTQRGLSERDTMRQRNWSIEDYYRQLNDYNDALKGQSTRNLQGALVNAGIGLGTKALMGGVGALGAGMVPGGLTASQGAMAGAFGISPWYKGAGG